MYKGLFKVESMQKPKRGNLKSYSKKRASYAKSFAVCFAIVTLASCGEKTGNSMFQTVKNAADAYRSYLSEVRKEANLPTDRLIEKINDWQSLRDSVSACTKDTNLREGTSFLLGFWKSGRNPHNSFGKVEICP